MHGLCLDKGIFRKYCETKFQEFLKLSVLEVVVVAVETVLVGGVALFVTSSSIYSLETIAYLLQTNLLFRFKVLEFICETSPVLANFSKGNVFLLLKLAVKCSIRSTLYNIG